MKKINLYWFKMVDGSTNYGDELNNFIISELSTQKVRYIPYPYKWYYIPYVYLHSLIFKSGYADLKGVFRSIFASKILFGIGSILHKFNRKDVTVWGSGIGHTIWKVDNADFKAVRGKFTLERLSELGYEIPPVIGDPGLLLPLLIQQSDKKYKLGIIPHYIQYDELLNNNNNNNNLSDSIIINMKEDIYKITNKITSCNFIISSSLHGIIVAQSYDIPALWVDFHCKNKLSGDNVKFKDYFSSVGIESYSPISIKSFETSYIKEILESNSSKLNIQTDLKEIQVNLLKVAPFNLKEKYKKIII